jgi:phage tail-like protein
MSSSNAGQRVDPYRGFNFLITLIDSTSALSTVVAAIQFAPQGGFSECSGLEMGLDIEEYKEGGNNGTVLHFPTRLKWTNLHLKRGVALTDDLWLWHYALAQGQVLRRDGLVTLQDEQHNPVKVWSFTRGLPVKWTGPALNAAQNQVAIEEIEIAHEGLQLL